MDDNGGYPYDFGNLHLCRFITMYIITYIYIYIYCVCKCIGTNLSLLLGVPPLVVWLAQVLSPKGGAVNSNSGAWSFSINSYYIYIYIYVHMLIIYI